MQQGLMPPPQPAPSQAKTRVCSSPAVCFPGRHAYSVGTAALAWKSVCRMQDTDAGEGLNSCRWWGKIHGQQEI